MDTCINMNRIKKAIKTGHALGRILASPESSESDIRVVVNWFRPKHRKERSVRNILDLKNIESGLSDRNEIDTAAAWERLKERMQAEQKPVAVVYRHTFRKLAYACLSVVLLTGLLYGRMQYRNSAREAQVMLAISEIRPESGAPMLYLGDGTAIPIGQEAPTLLDGAGLELDVDNETLSYGTSQSKQAEYNTLVIPKGRSFHVVLCDGTEVWLNTNSTLRYFTTDHSDERRVYLEGEAFFNVARDESRPFIVVSGDQAVTVLGTRFNITAYGAENMKYTTLVEGKVAVEVLERDDAIPPVFLDNPGAQSIYYRDGQKSISERQVDPEIYTAWMNGVFRFSNTSLEDILFRLSQWYGFSYSVVPEMKDCKFSGEFGHFDDLDKVLDILRKTGVGFSIDYTDGRIMIGH